MATKTADRLAWNSTAAVTQNAYGSAAVSDKVLAHDDGSVGFLVTYVKANTSDIIKSSFKLAKGNFWSSDLGAKVIYFNSTTTVVGTQGAKFLGPFESARFKDSSGYLNYKISRLTTAGVTSTATTPTGSGVVTIFQMPGKVKFST